MKEKFDKKAYNRAYNQKPEVKAYHKTYNRAYYQRPEIKAYHKTYNQKIKERKKLSLTVKRANFMKKLGILK